MLIPDKKKHLFLCRSCSRNPLFSMFLPHYATPFHYTFSWLLLLFHIFNFVSALQFTYRTHRRRLFKELTISTKRLYLNLRGKFIIIYFYGVCFEFECCQSVRLITYFPCQFESRKIQEKGYTRAPVILRKQILFQFCVAMNLAFSIVFL